jgi:hypothetical protein
MEPADGPVTGGMKLLWKGGRMYVLHAGTYLLLMIFAVLALLLFSVFTVFVILPDLQGKDFHEISMEIGTLQKLGVAVTFLLSLAVFYRALAASILATSEFGEGGKIDAIQAFRRVRWKHTRLFWLMLTATFFGPLAPFVGLIAGFFFASAFPTAVVEDLGAFQALKRGEKLGSGNGLRIATVYVAYLVVLAGVGAAIFKVLSSVSDQLGNGRYPKPVPSICFLVFFTVVQWYMIVLTLNYLQQRKKLTD